MITLQSCHLRISPAPAPAPFTAASARVARPPTSMLAAFAPPGCRERRLPSLKLKQLPRLVALVRAAQNCAGAPAQQPGGSVAGGHFVEERKHVMDRYNDIIHIDHGCLYKEATKMSGEVCLAANQALTMASHVMNSASLNLGAPNVISPDTTHLTLRAYVRIFLEAADASYEKRVSKDTLVSFHGALKGLASISHILLEDALEALSYTHPRASLSEYTFNYDVKDMRVEFDYQMDGIEHRITKASASDEMGKVVMPGILEATRITASLVKLMVARREKVLGKAKAAVYM